MNALIIIGRLMVAAICATGAVLLAYEGKDGWGWLIFAAILLGGITIQEREK